MAPSRADFRAKFRALSPAAATDYLADLYGAQGFSVDREDGRLSVTRDGNSRTVALAETADASDADVVVTRGGRASVPPGVEHLDPDELYERTRYAIDPETSDRLIETYFDGLSEGAAPATPRTERPQPDAQPSTTVGPDSDTRSAVAVWSRRALLVAGGAVLGGGTAAFATTSPRDGEAAVTTPERTPTPTPSVTVPGLSADGVTSPDSLADAHAAAADAQSYRLSLSEFRHDNALELRSAISLELSLSADRGYLAIVQTAGPDAPLVLGRPPARSVYWSDGDVYYVDHRPDSWGGVSTFQPPNGWVGTWQYWAHVFAYGGTIDSSPADYFRSLLGAVSARLVGRDGTAEDPRHRLAGRAPVPESDLEPLAGSNHRDLEFSAVVDGAGLIRAHELGYRARFDGEDGRVRRSLEYTGVGETDVTRPLWAD